MVSLGYKDSPEVAERIDRFVWARRREDPTQTYSRSKFLREAVNRALAEHEAETPPRVRERVRATAA